MATPSILRYVRHTDTPPVYGRFVDLKGLNALGNALMNAVMHAVMHALVRPIMRLY